MLDLRSADAMSQCAKRAVGGGVAIAAHHGHAGQGGTVFRADHMHDALALRQKRKKRSSTKFFDVRVQSSHLLFADGVGNAVVTQLPASGGRVVVCRSNDGADPPNFASRLANALKRLGAGDFMHQMPIYIEYGGAVFFGVDDVFVPNLVVQGAGHGVPLDQPVILKCWLAVCIRAKYRRGLNRLL